MSGRLDDNLHARPVLTDQARRALGIPVDGRPVEIVLVPVLDLPMRDDAKDRR